MSGALSNEEELAQLKIRVARLERLLSAFVGYVDRCCYCQEFFDEETEMVECDLCKLKLICNDCAEKHTWVCIFGTHTVVDHGSAYVLLCAECAVGRCKGCCEQLVGDDTFENCRKCKKL